jgi:hypothetical protein
MSKIYCFHCETIHPIEEFKPCMECNHSRCKTQWNECNGECPFGISKQCSGIRFFCGKTGSIHNGKFELCHQCGMYACGVCIRLHQGNCDKQHQENRIKWLEERVEKLEAILLKKI